MRLRNIIIVCLLAVALIATSAARPPVASARAGLLATPEEEGEARELVLALVKRFHETGDIAPLAREFFVGDFAERPRAEGDGDAPDTPTRHLEREVLRQASPEELRSFYVAELNLICAVVIYMTSRYNEREAAGVRDDGDEVELTDELPREVVELLKTDAARFVLAADERDEKCSHAKDGDAVDCDGNAVTAEDCGPPVKSVTQLREVTTALGKAVAALRAHMPPPRTVFKEEARRTKDEEVEHFHVYRPRLWVTDEEYLGCPPGTRLISAEAQPLLALQFRFQLIRVDGRLRVLSMAAVLDGD
jgi:hypothetical protein